jgi:hypothetical protein
MNTRMRAHFGLRAAVSHPCVPLLQPALCIAIPSSALIVQQNSANMDGNNQHAALPPPNFGILESPPDNMSVFETGPFKVFLPTEMDEQSKLQLIIYLIDTTETKALVGDAKRLSKKRLTEDWAGFTGLRLSKRSYSRFARVARDTLTTVATLLMPKDPNAVLKLALSNEDETTDRVGAEVITTMIKSLEAQP